MEELYVVIGTDFSNGHSWICEYEYKEDDDYNYKQALTKDEAFKLIRELDEIGASNDYEYKLAKLSFLD